MATKDSLFDRPTFYADQQRLWIELLLHFTRDKAMIEEVLQLFQGGVLAFLITGDAERGRRVLRKMTSRGRAKS
jgi:hypothetical protein